MLTRSRKAKESCTARQPSTDGPFPCTLPTDLVVNILNMLPRDEGGLFMDAGQRLACMLVSRAWAGTLRAMPESGWKRVQAKQVGTHSSSAPALKQLYQSLGHAQTAGAVALHVVMPKLSSRRIDLTSDAVEAEVPPDFSYASLAQRLRSSADRLQRFKLTMFSSCTASAHPTLKPLAPCFVNLTLLDLSACDFPPTDLPALVPHMQRLQTLTLKYITNSYHERAYRWPGLTGARGC